MAASEPSTLADAPNRYDGLVGLVVLLVLAWAFLVTMQPILGLLLAAAFVSAYAAGRIDDVEHAVVVAGLWAVVLAAFWVVGTYIGVAVAAVLAVVGYGRWRNAW